MKNLASSYSASGHYGCPQANTKAIPLQATINLFTNWLLGSTWIPGFNQAIMGFTRPYSLGQYGSAVMDCASQSLGF